MADDNSTKTWVRMDGAYLRRQASEALDTFVYPVRTIIEALSPGKLTPAPKSKTYYKRMRLGSHAAAATAARKAAEAAVRAADKRRERKAAHLQHD